MGAVNVMRVMFFVWEVSMLREGEGAMVTVFWCGGGGV